jgi:hypothetical protein
MCEEFAVTDAGEVLELIVIQVQHFQPWAELEAAKRAKLPTI